MLAGGIEKSQGYILKQTKIMQLTEELTIFRERPDRECLKGIQDFENWWFEKHNFI